MINILSRVVDDIRVATRFYRRCYVPYFISAKPSRFGLYGLPLERTIFAAEVPELGRGSSTPVTYASVLAGDNATPPSAKTDCQLKDLLNLPPDIGE